MERREEPERRQQRRRADEGPDVRAVGEVAAEHLGPLLYALEVCAVHMDRAGRGEEAEYYRNLARLLAVAGGKGDVKSEK